MNKKDLSIMLWQTVNEIQDIIEQMDHNFQKFFKQISEIIQGTQENILKHEPNIIKDINNPGGNNE
jgi:uncharacterized protein YoxC